MTPPCARAHTHTHRAARQVLTWRVRAPCHVTQDELGQGQQANEKQRSMRELEETAKVRPRQLVLRGMLRRLVCVCRVVRCGADALWYMFMFGFTFLLLSVHNRAAGWSGR